MKRFISAIITLCMTWTVSAQDIKMTITDGISNPIVKNRMEKSISELLSEINMACAQERPLRLEQMDMALSGKKSLQALWKSLHFLCEDNEIVERCLTSAEGYVIRNVYIQVNPMIRDYQDDKDRALTILWPSIVPEYLSCSSGHTSRGTIRRNKIGIRGFLSPF